MKLYLYQIDAFTDKVFGGNPACVVPLHKWLEDETLLKIAQENAVSETAFFVQNDNFFHLRWFTPDIEMDLCGHATLAAAYVIKKYLKYPKDVISFNSLSGKLDVLVNGENFTLDFPSREPINSKLPLPIKDSLSIQPQKILKSRDYFLVYGNQKEIEDIKINRSIIDQINLDPGGVIITAKGDDCDFVSRWFAPQSSIFEDPVTGSAHCSLIPYWSKQLNKKKMEAIQLSARKGKLFCEDKGERVLISGKATTYFIGNIWIDQD